MLHPSLAEESRVEELRRGWRAEGSLRIAPFLDEDEASALLQELRATPYEFRAAEPSRFNFQYWELEIIPHGECDHLRCRLGRWLWNDGARWLSELTEMELGPAPEGLMVSTLYDQGCYLDPHSDADGQRQLAFVLGLTPQPRALEAGGHLEFLDAAEGLVTLSERRPAAWNTLDIFDVRSHSRVHRVSLVTEPSERRAVSGWFWRPS